MVNQVFIIFLGNGILKEHLIPIILDIKYEETCLKDSFDFDILNTNNMYSTFAYFSPEDLASCIVADLKLPREFFILISLSVRKQIKEYVFSLFDHYSSFCVNNMQNSKKIVINKNKKNKNNAEEEINSEEKIDDSTKEENTEYNPTIDLNLYENRLEIELGPLHKFKHSTRDLKYHKPLFLKNRLKNKKKQQKSVKNRMILFISLNKIIISKQILKVEYDYDRIIIDKNKIIKFL